MKFNENGNANEYVTFDERPTKQGKAEYSAQNCRHS